MTARVAELAEQLEDERRERRLLVEAVHGLVEALRTGKPEAFSALPMSPETALPRPMAAAAPTVLPCPASDQDIEDIVFAAILTVDRDATGFDQSTKFDISGLGWNDVRKRSAFNLVRFGLMDEGCQFAAQAGDFASLKTVGDMVKLARTKSFV
jgi:hypothetical protein